MVFSWSAVSPGRAGSSRRAGHGFGGALAEPVACGAAEPAPPQRRRPERRRRCQACPAAAIGGAGNIARLLAIGWWKRDAERSVEPVQINGGPGLLVRVNGEIDGVVAVRVENGYITGAYHVRNPEKLSRVERETAVSR